MKLEDYEQFCLDTWFAGDKELLSDYGILGELGELSEVQKKYYRGDFDLAIKKERELKELGDSLFYIVINLYVKGFNLSKIAQRCIRQPVADVHGILFDTTESFLEFRECSYEYQAEVLVQKYIYLVTTLGYTLEQVIEANVLKLTSRIKRGTQQGSGDDR